MYFHFEYNLISQNKCFPNLIAEIIYFAKLYFRHIDHSKNHEVIHHKHFLRAHLVPGAIIKHRTYSLRHGGWVYKYAGTTL